MQAHTEDGRRFRMLTVIDEFTRRCLAIVVARKLRSDDVLHCLTDLFVLPPASALPYAALGSARRWPRAAGF
jgi:hypothetical protein